MDAVNSVASRRFLSILIADDDRDTVNTLEAILVDEGHTVHKVYRGDEVLGAVKRYTPDVCILDIEMPGPSGYAAARQVLTAMGQDAQRRLRPLLHQAGRSRGASAVCGRDRGQLGPTA